MLLYKFRSLENLEHVLDIILNQRLHCSHYTQLNDPFEGLFFKLFTVLDKITPVPSDPIRLRIESGEDNKNICSLCASLNDVRMWSHYADGHKGLAIEIDFPETTDQLFEVTYNATPLFYEKDSAEDQISLTEILTQKTDHWIYEKEYRLFHEDKFFTIPNMIKAIFLGFSMPLAKIELLNKIIPKAIDLYETRLDRKELFVIPGPPIKRG